MAHKTETMESTRNACTKNTKHLCKLSCYGITNLELTSGRIIPNSHTRNSDVASAVTLQILIKNSTRYSHQRLSFSNQIAYMEEFFQVYGNVNCTRRGISFEVFRTTFCFGVRLFHVFRVFSANISTHHREVPKTSKSRFFRFFIPVGPFFL